MRRRKLRSMYRSKRKNLIVNKPINATDLAFGDLFYDISDNWTDNENRLRIRRWKRLKHELNS